MLDNLKNLLLRSNEGYIFILVMWKLLDQK